MNSFLNYYQPNQFQTREYNQIAGRRNSTYPDIRHPVEIFPRPSMPLRIDPSALSTATRAKNTRESPCASAFGLTVVTVPRNVRVGYPFNFTAAFCPSRNRLTSESSIATSTTAV